MFAITDLFSHKIHSSDDSWPDKLVELAFIFAEFDGQSYQRDLIDQKLQRFSPRATHGVRDPSKFRDEYSAYPAYLGLYHLEMSSQGWKVKIGETTRKLLLQEEPDVAGFLRLQLTLFQYPNGMGAIYNERYAGKVKVQANTRDKTLEIIRRNIHLSPLRLITGALIADATFREVPLLNAQISFAEIYALCNSTGVNQSVCPPHDILIALLEKVRSGAIHPPASFEKRFHLLKHLGLFEVKGGRISFRIPTSELDRIDMEKKIETIASVEKQFTQFDHITDSDTLDEAIVSGLWPNYFDAVKTLDDHTISILARDWTFEQPNPLNHPDEEPLTFSNNLFPLKHRDSDTNTTQQSSRQREMADPEVTKIKRQRRNLEHKMILERIDGLLRSLGAEPMENPHIDLYAEIPDDGSFIFEVKSGGGNLLAQIRKAISQLYEYRFRYRDSLRKDVELCLVLPNKPTEIPWIEEYLCSDRGICLCWIDQAGQLGFSELCADKVVHLIA